MKESKKHKPSTKLLKQTSLHMSDEYVSNGHWLMPKSRFVMPKTKSAAQLPITALSQGQVNYVLDLATKANNPLTLTDTVLEEGELTIAILTDEQGNQYRVQAQYLKWLDNTVKYTTTQYSLDPICVRSSTGDLIMVVMQCRPR